MKCYHIGVQLFYKKEIITQNRTYYFCQINFGCVKGKSYWPWGIYTSHLEANPLFCEDLMVIGGGLLKQTWKLVSYYGKMHTESVVAVC